MHEAGVLTRIGIGLATIPMSLAWKGWQQNRAVDIAYNLQLIKFKNAYDAK